MLQFLFYTSMALKLYAMQNGQQIHSLSTEFSGIYDGFKMRVEKVLNSGMAKVHSQNKYRSKLNFFII